MKWLYYLFGNLDLNPIPDVQADSAHLQGILNTVLGVMGAVGVLIVVVAGLRLIFSQGDPSVVTATRNTIIYTLVGLVVIMFVFAIVNFVVLGIGSGG